MSSLSYTIEELAKASGLSTRSVYEHARKGRLKGACPAYRLGWRFTVEEVRAWADLHLRSRTKERLVEELAKPPPPKWCGSSYHEALHFIFAEAGPQGGCLALVDRPVAEWFPVSAEDQVSRRKCAACLRAEKHWLEHGRAP